LSREKCKSNQGDVVLLHNDSDPNSELKFPPHQILLTLNETYILENLDTSELLCEKIWEFALLFRAVAPYSFSDSETGAVSGVRRIQPISCGIAKAGSLDRHAISGLSCLLAARLLLYGRDLLLDPGMIKLSVDRIDGTFPLPSIVSAVLTQSFP
jgi:hypothetical protein